MVSLPDIHEIQADVSRRGELQFLVSMYFLYTMRCLEEQYEKRWYNNFHGQISLGWEGGCYMTAKN